MSSSDVLPPLKAWAEQHLVALIKANTVDDFNRAFDNFIAKDVEIVFNGEKHTRDEYKRFFQGGVVEGNTADVTFQNVLVAPALGAKETLQSGVVGLFYKTTIQSDKKAGEATILSALNIRVEQDESIGDADRRRVFALNKVYGQLAT